MAKKGSRRRSGYRKKRTHKKEGEFNKFWRNYCGLAGMKCLADTYWAVDGAWILSESGGIAHPEWVPDAIGKNLGNNWKKPAKSAAIATVGHEAARALGLRRLGLVRLFVG